MSIAVAAIVLGGLLSAGPVAAQIPPDLVAPGPHVGVVVMGPVGGMPDPAPWVQGGLIMYVLACTAPDGCFSVHPRLCAHPDGSPGVTVDSRTPIIYVEASLGLVGVEGGYSERC